MVQVREVFSNQAGSAGVYRDESKGGGTYHTVITIKDTKIKRSILGLLESSGRAEAFTAIEAKGDGLHLCFPYRQERSLIHFIPVHVQNANQCIALFQRMLTELMTLSLPAPLLYLLLTERNLNLDQNGSVYFNYFLDFTQYNEDIGENACAERCGELILKLLREQPLERNNEKAVQLLEYKRIRCGYTTFLQLYRDLDTGKSRERESLQKRLAYMVRRYRDRWYVWLRGAAFVCLALVFLFFLHETVFDQLSLLLRYTGMEQIGTVNLK